MSEPTSTTERLSQIEKKDLECWGCKGTTETPPRMGRTAPGCVECAARSLARTTDFADSMKRQWMTHNYRQALYALFGDDWRNGHAKVKAWAEKLKT